ncbi:MAG: hypothetical protein KAH20_14190 [Methylococcales bacterium]|nr:hypothetical protein [Methylococcales bacterium]
MFLRKLFYTCSIISLTLSPILTHAETDPDYTNGVLTMPRVTSEGKLYGNVRLQLNFNDNTFSLLGAEPRTRFSSKTNGIDEILIDNIDKHTWVNGSHACKINADAATTATSDASAHCDTLDFAGYQDWRAPTSAEISDMIINANKLNITLNYRNPNCQFMAASDGFVKTENTTEPGKIVDSAVNSGTRCVR